MKGEERAYGAPARGLIDDNLGGGLIGQTRLDSRAPREQVGWRE
jgi:hypothetical protein